MFREFPSIRAFTGPRVCRETLADTTIAAQMVHKLMSEHLAKVKVKRTERHRTPRATEHLYHPGGQVIVWMEKQINNRIGIFRGPFDVFSFDTDSKIVLIEEKICKASKRYNKPKVKPYVEDPEEVTFSFVSSEK